ncbi:hypothetical protein LINPERPRIM_LOCUS37330 [Linum perenne]
MTVCSTTSSPLLIA